MTQIRAMKLEDEFHDYTMRIMTITEYCAGLKRIVDNLADVYHIISKKFLVLQCLVLQCIRGLNNNDYSSLVNVIPLQQPFLTFSQTRSLLL